MANTRQVPSNANAKRRADEQDSTNNRAQQPNAEENESCHA